MSNKELLSELLETWEETYKKGQLTFWIFLSLKESKKYVDEIKRFIVLLETCCQSKKLV